MLADLSDLALTPLSPQLSPKRNLRLPPMRFTLQSVISKCDLLPYSDAEMTRILETFRKQIMDIAPACLPPLMTSVRGKGGNFGVEALRANIAEVCGVV